MRAAETGLTKNQILSELSRSPHGKLQEYVGVGQRATKQEPEFLAHLIAWDRMKGSIRDAKVALPVVSLSTGTLPPELAENSLAHVGMLGPRELARAYRFALELRLPKQMRSLRRVVEAYLKEREKSWPKWERLAIQHRKTLKELYSLIHLKPSPRVDMILFKGERPAGSVFEVVANLKDMSPTEAAGTIMERKIPFLIALGALGKKAHEPELVQALIQRMSPTELVSNTKMLEKLGVKSNPALKGEFEKALVKASGSKANILKTTRAAESLEDGEIKEKLRGLQEKQLSALGGVDGDWLVLADKSGSMSQAIELARQVSATLAKMVKGSVTLIFFDVVPARVFDVTGQSYDQIKADTKYVTADGGTSIGCGLQYAMDRKVEVDGIAVVSDAAENTPPFFADRYKAYSAMIGKEVPVYLYRVGGGMPYYSDRDLANSLKTAGIDCQEFATEGIDFYSLPNLVTTMRTQRYSLIDEVMATPLLTLGDVFKQTEKEEIINVA